MLHTSGISNYTNDRTFMQAEVAKPASMEKIMALFKDKPLDFSPGTELVVFKQRIFNAGLYNRVGNKKAL